MRICSTAICQCECFEAIYTITLIYPRGSNSEHKPGAQNEHQPNAENKGLIWWYDTDKFLYQNQTMDQVDTMNM